MHTPSELALLAALRRRGQCPTMTVFVTDNWEWASKLEDFGCLAIRVRSSDHALDWSPLCGLSVILLQRFGDASLAQAILAARPSDFETYRLPRGSQIVCGSWLSPSDRAKRDILIAKLLLAA